MNREYKKTNTLFHSIREYSSLEKIIADKGFRASYADEVIAGNAAKILMVSFSNVALLESQSQVNYGNYTVGLTLDWGKKNKLEPVMYTYNESYIGATFLENYFVAQKDSIILQALGERSKTKDDNFGLIMDLKQISENSHNMLMHLKPYMVKNKAGNEFIAYNDREWRYVHKNTKFLSVIFERDFFHGGKSSLFEEANTFSKPFTSEPVLTFGLDDLKYILVESKSQKTNVFKVLSASFGYEEVVKKTIEGDLDILSRDTLWDNL